MKVLILIGDWIIFQAKQRFCLNFYAELLNFVQHVGVETLICEGYFAHL